MERIGVALANKVKREACLAWKFHVAAGEDTGEDTRAPLPITSQKAFQQCLGMICRLNAVRIADCARRV
jgi:hypothetical protein